MAHTTMINTRYVVDREVWNSWQALIVRMRAASPSLPSLPKSFSMNRWSVLAIDALFAAVAALDNKQPSKMFDAHNWYLGRDRINQLVQLEARIAALGY
jgi:hypothetical protein